MKEQILAVQRMQDYIEQNKTEEIRLSDLARAATQLRGGEVKVIDAAYLQLSSEEVDA